MDTSTPFTHPPDGSFDPEKCALEAVLDQKKKRVKELEVELLQAKAQSLESYWKEKVDLLNELVADLKNDNKLLRKAITNDDAWIDGFCIVCENHTGNHSKDCCMKGCE